MWYDVMWYDMLWYDMMWYDMMGGILNLISFWSHLPGFTSSSYDIEESRLKGKFRAICVLEDRNEEQILVKLCAMMGRKMLNDHTPNAPYYLSSVCPSYTRNDDSVRDKDSYRGITWRPVELCGLSWCHFQSHWVQHASCEGVGGGCEDGWCRTGCFVGHCTTLTVRYGPRVVEWFRRSTDRERPDPC